MIDLLKVFALPLMHIVGQLPSLRGLVAAAVVAGPSLRDRGRKHSTCTKSHTCFVCVWCKLNIKCRSMDIRPMQHMAHAAVWLNTGV